MHLDTRSEWHRFIREKAGKPRKRTSPRKLYDFEDLVEDLLVKNEIEDYKKLVYGVRSIRRSDVD